MKVFIGINNNIINDTGFTSLLGVSDEMGVPYDSAVRGKRKWIKGNDLIEIKEIEIVKIKNRGKK